MRSLRIVPSLTSRAFQLNRRISTTDRYQASPAPTIPYTPTCPSAACQCSPPPIPSDLEIDRKASLLHTVAAYSSQVLISTGKDDWTSRIEDEQSTAGDFIRGLKGVVGRGGDAFDPFNNILITASSFPSTTATEKDTKTSILLFPHFLSIPSLPSTPSTLLTLARAHLTAETLHPMHAEIPVAQKAILTRNSSLAADLPSAEPIITPTILICGHAGRDARCGIIGPILRSAFKAETERLRIDARVGVISHIGGHKYAGNVIVYVPPGWKSDTGVNPLSGMGIWYGRVGPEHVEGVVDETLVKGRIVKDLLRGGITREGRDLGRLLEAQVKSEEGVDEGLKLRPRARG